eukprot:3331166-Pyramimonas_sp.AAC.1
MRGRRRAEAILRHGAHALASGRVQHHSHDHRIVRADLSAIRARDGDHALARAGQGGEPQTCKKQDVPTTVNLTKPTKEGEEEGEGGRVWEGRMRTGEEDEGG